MNIVNDRYPVCAEVNPNDFEEKLEIAEDEVESFVCQACGYIDDVTGKFLLDSMGSSSFAFILKHLENIGRIKIIKEHERRIIAEKVEVQK